MHQQSFSLWKRIPFLFNLTASGRQRNAALKFLHNETRRVIKLRRAQMNEEATLNPQVGNNDEDNMFGSKRRLAFLDSLLLAQKETGRLTDANIQEEVDTFMFEVKFCFNASFFKIFILSNLFGQFGAGVDLKENAQNSI